MTTVHTTPQNHRLPNPEKRKRSNQKKPTEQNWVSSVNLNSLQLSKISPKQLENNLPNSVRVQDSAHSKPRLKKASHDWNYVLTKLSSTRLKTSYSDSQTRRTEHKHMEHSFQTSTRTHNKYPDLILERVYLIFLSAKFSKRRKVKWKANSISQEQYSTWTSFSVLDPSH